MRNIYITTYVNPDLDGVACAAAYSEFLKIKGISTLLAIFGQPHMEAKFVLKEFNISISYKNKVEGNDEVILVDASDLNGISKTIDRKNIVEIIDHRPINESDKFINAKVQIELVGAAATLVAERFYKDQIKPSKGSAALLYSAIISNTINFKAKVTTERDKKMAEWLKPIAQIRAGYEREMFVNKSNLKKTIYRTLYDDFAWFDFETARVGIAQLEIIGAKDFVINNFKKIIESLNIIKQEKECDIIFLTCIDVEKGLNVFVAPDERSKQILKKILNPESVDNILFREGIIMRKEIVPLLKNNL